MRKIILAFLLALPAVVQANFAECILDSVPGIRHEQVLRAAVRTCWDKHPKGFDGAKWGAGRGFFAKHKSADECFATEGRDTGLTSAASMIFQACDRLYGEGPKPPEPDWERGVITPPPR